jgi:protein-S-isoprenylcysteine O-methyltransferase Ste14
MEIVAMQRALIVWSFLLLVTLILVTEGVRKLRGGEVLGKPSITPWIFYLGKVLMVASWGFMFFQAAGSNLSPLVMPDALMWVPTMCFVGGAILVALSFLQLGEATRMGLPTDTVQLKTTGLYGFSRNPLYLGAYIMGIASCVYCPHPANLLVTIGFIVIHHRIVLGEEVFLQNTFADAWRTYSGKVRRYM